MLVRLPLERKTSLDTLYAHLISVNSLGHDCRCQFFCYLHATKLRLPDLVVQPFSQSLPLLAADAARVVDPSLHVPLLLGGDAQQPLPAAAAWSPGTKNRNDKYLSNLHMKFILLQRTLTLTKI